MLGFLRAMWPVIWLYIACLCCDYVAYYLAAYDYAFQAVVAVLECFIVRLSCDVLWPAITVNAFCESCVAHTGAVNCAFL